MILLTTKDTTLAPGASAGEYTKFGQVMVAILARDFDERWPKRNLQVAPQVILCDLCVLRGN